MERRPRNKKGKVLANAVVRIYAFIVTAHNTARLNKTPMVMITQDRRERARAANKRGPTVGRKGTGDGGGRARGCSRLIHKTTGSAQRLSDRASSANGNSRYAKPTPQATASPASPASPAPPDPAAPRQPVSAL